MDNCVEIHCRLILRGTVWCGVGLVSLPGMSEPLPFLVCYDSKALVAKTGGNMPVASAAARIAARNEMIDAVADSIKASAPGTPLAARVEESLSDLKDGMKICEALRRHNPAAIIAVMNLHDRAMHQGDPVAQREMQILRECMDLHDNGRCSIKVEVAPHVGTYSTAGRNPPSGRGAHDLVSGRNPPSGRGAQDLVSGRNPPSGRFGTAMPSSHLTSGGM